MANNIINTILIEFIYLIAILVPSLIIYNKTRKLYKFSSYKGLRYFSSAFFFISIAFLMRFIVIAIKIINSQLSTINSVKTFSTFNILTITMEFLMILPGLYILLSLFWQKLEKINLTKKFTKYEVIIFILALTVSLIDYSLKTLLIMYISQILIFSLASIMSFQKYKNKKNNYKQLFFISMIVFLIVWIFNLIAQYTINQFPFIRVYTYLFTITACFIILYITLNLTNNKNEEKKRKA